MMTCDALLDKLAGAGLNPRRSGTHWQSRCPAHDDSNPSLSITPIEGSILIWCHAGCAVEAILTSIGLSLRDLYDDPSGMKYRYPEEHTVVRTPNKGFRQTKAPRGETALYRRERVLAEQASDRD